MDEIYWNRFLETGKVADYLYYKGMGVCEAVMDRYATADGADARCSCTTGSQKKGGNEADGEPDHSDRHGACGDSYR